MLGPGLALRGQDGANSMHKAVESMKSESKHCFTFFLLQLLSFHCSSFLLMWVLYSKTVAIIINCILAVFLLVFIHNGFEIYNALNVSDEDAISGKFTNFAQYEGMNDLDGKDMNSLEVDRRNVRSQQNEKVGISDAVNYVSKNSRDLYEGGEMQ